MLLKDKKLQQPIGLREWSAKSCMKTRELTQVEEASERKLQIIADSIENSEQYNKWKKCGRSWFNSGYSALGSFALMLLSVWFSTVVFSLSLGFLGIFLALYNERNNEKIFKLFFQTKNDEYVMIEGSFDIFNLRCLKQKFSMIEVKNEKYSELENITRYMQGGGVVKIIYIYKGEQIAVDSYDLNSISSIDKDNSSVQDISNAIVIETKVKK